MKKLLIVLLTFAALSIAAVYIFIPNIINFRCSVSVGAPQQALYRAIGEDNNWEGWWPGESKPDTGKAGNWLYSYNGVTYRPTKKTATSLFFLNNTKKSNAESLLTFIHVKQDSTNFVWDAAVPTSYNPIKRLQIYFDVKNLKNNFNSILQKIKTFFSVTGNLYEFNIRNEKVVDSNLVSTFENTKDYPTMEFAYSLIDKLKQYISSKGAKETGYPMLNISTTDNITWLTRVAVPADKKLESSGNISYKWMLGGGNILITEVNGGPGRINKAMEQVENYIKDYQRIAAAIPFQSLVTDRRTVTDTSKWITRIYYPVI